jgi:hypothetical protein
MPLGLGRAYRHETEGCAGEAMHRRLVWVERQNLEGWGCSECAWVFTPVGAPIGNSLDEMKEKFGQQRDKEFAAHVCAEHPGPKSKKT